MAMSGLCFTYLAPDSQLDEDEWGEVCTEERDHPDPHGLNEWNTRALDALTAYQSDLQNTEPFVYDDGEGPVYFLTSGGDIQMVPVKRYTPPPSMDAFAVWWGYCQAIASAGPTFAYDLDYFEAIDISLDIEQARSVYEILM